MDDQRPNPDLLLEQITKAEINEGRGKLRLFFGMAAGVGKTYAMLKSAQERMKEGVDVVVGIVETHGRPETEALLKGLLVVPRKQVSYRGTSLEEMDLDAVLARRPALVLVDELAHSNVLGSRHEKRYQDVIEILEAGIDVYSTMNVQHLESRVDVVELITAVNVRERVPDSIIDVVDQIDLVDITPEALIERLKEGKVYPGRMTQQALQYFFQESNLSALREIALRVTADKVERDLKDHAPVESVALLKESRKLLVAVSHSPFSERLIRTARRLVDDLEIPWVAVHIDTGTTLSPRDQNQLVKNLNLAEEMGAQTLTLYGTDMASLISDYAASHNVVQIIMGRPGLQASYKERRRSSKLIEHLIEKNPNTDITVMQQPEAGRGNVKKRFRFHGDFKPKSYLIAMLAVALVAILSFWLQSIVGYRVIGFAFLLLTVILGLLLPFSAVFMAAALSALVWDYGFIPPRGTFTIGAPEDVMMFVAYFVIAIASGFLTARAKRHQDVLRQREEWTSSFYEILRAMTLVRGADRVIELSLSKCEALFEAECSIVLAEDGGLSEKTAFGNHEVSAKEYAVAAWCFEHGRMAGWSTDTLSMSSVLCLALKSGEDTFGVLMMRPKVDRKLTPDQENMLIGIANQIGMVLAKRKYDEETRKAKLLHDSEVLHQTLLNSISHELRTPLTAIMGAATALESQLAEKGRAKELLGGIVDASERLNRIFENLLDVTRIEAGAVKLKSEWFEVSELMRAVVDRLARLVADQEIVLRVPEQPVYFLGDYELLAHVLSNLLLNAASYAPLKSQITLSCKIDHSFIVIEVIDQGPGIPEHQVPHIFEKFYRLPGSLGTGLGLGLSIAKNLVELHGGKIGVRAGREGGSVFTILLPVKDLPKQLQELE